MESNEARLAQPVAALVEGRFAGPSAFAEAIRTALEVAASEGWGEMIWSDASFEDWPLYEKAVVESLHAWARRGRTLTLLAHRFDAMRRMHHRFVEWRIRWDHVLDCRVCRGVEESEFPSVLWSPAWTVQRTDLVRCTGMVRLDAGTGLALREKLDERKRQSTPGFPATTLGL